MADLNCSDFFTQEQFKHLALARGVAASVCLGAILFTLGLILGRRAYRSLLQRLFLYLTISTAAQLLFVTLQIEHAVKYDHDHACGAIGFLVQYSTHIVLYFITGSVIYLVYCVWKASPGGRQQASPRRRQQQLREMPLWLRTLLELVFILFCVMFPATYTWEPFVYGNYGRYRAWCWITATNDDCSRNLHGLGEQLGLGYVPAIIIGFFTTVLFIVLFVKYCRWACKYDTVQEQLRREAVESLLLSAFFVVYSLHCIFELAGRVVHWSSYNNNWLYNTYALWMVYAVSAPLTSLIIPIAFLFYLYCRLQCHCHQYEPVATEDPDHHEEREVPDAHELEPTGTPSFTTYDPPST